MRRTKRRLFNLFAFSLLAFAIYLNFFYKEQQPGIIRSEPAKQPVKNSSHHVTLKNHTAAKQ